MRNINIKDGDNIEEILEKENLPISINNEIVCISYDEYMSALRKLDPQKAKEIEQAIEFQRYSEYFSEEIISELKINLRATWPELNFASAEEINCIAGTFGWAYAIKATISEKSFYDDFIKWYEQLPWDESDYFDTYIEEKLLEY